MTPPDVRIRPLDDAADTRGVLRVGALAWRAAYDEILPSEALPDDPEPDPDRVERAHRGLTREDRSVLVAESSAPGDADPGDSGSGDPESGDHGDVDAPGEATDPGTLDDGDDGGRVCGYAYARWGDDVKSFVGDREAGLKELYVAPDRWGEGVGTALLDRAVASLPDGTERLVLETLRDNDLARGFYEARGFRERGRSEFEVAGDPYPTTVYVLDL